MPFIASHFRAPFVQVSGTDPVDTAYPANQFQVGTILHAADIGTDGTIYQNWLDGSSVRFWLQLSNTAASLALAGEFAPMYFSGRVAFGEGGSVVSYHAQDPGVGNQLSTTQLRYTRSVTAPNVVRLAQLRVYVTINTSTTASAAFQLMQNTTAVGPIVTFTPGQTLLQTGTPSTPVTVANGDTFDLRLIAGNNAGTNITFTAEASFEEP